MKLRELDREDCEHVRKWRNENLVSLRTPYLLTKEMQEDFYKNVICNRDSNHRYWGIWQDELDQLIGTGGITNIQWENSIAEISLILDPQQISKGYGTQAVDLLLDKAFNYMGLKTVFGECYTSNLSIVFWKKVVEEYNGFQTDLPNRKFWEGKFYNSIYSSIDRDEFNKGKDEN